MSGSIVRHLRSGWGVELPAADVWVMSRVNAAQSARISTAELWRHSLWKSPAALVWLVDHFSAHNSQPPVIWAEFWHWLAPRAESLFPKSSVPFGWQLDDNARARWRSASPLSFAQVKDFCGAAVVADSIRTHAPGSRDGGKRLSASRRRAVVKSLINRRLWESLTHGRDGVVEQKLAELLVEFERQVAAGSAEQNDSAGLANPRSLEPPVAMIQPPSPAKRVDDEQLGQHAEKILQYAEERSAEFRAPEMATDGEFERRLHLAKMQSLKNFAYGASHEINNPLANIVMRAESLSKSEQDPQRRKRLDAIRQQAWRAHHMISDLMLFANPPAPVWQRVSLAEFIVATADASCQTCDSPPRMTWNIARTPACQESESWIDPTMLRELLVALWNNARQAIGERTAGAIHTALDRVPGGGGHTLQISDNGAGIPAACLPFIFDPFFSGREAGRGLGFGLSKAWRIAEIHGGELTCVSSRPGQTQFEVVLPTLPPNAPPANPVPVASEVGSGVDGTLARNVGS